MEASRLKYSGKVPEEETGDGPTPSQTPESNKRASCRANAKNAGNGAIHRLFHSWACGSALLVECFYRPLRGVLCH